MKEKKKEEKPKNVVLESKRNREFLKGTSGKVKKFPDRENRFRKNAVVSFS